MHSHVVSSIKTGVGVDAVKAALGEAVVLLSP